MAFKCSNGALSPFFVVVLFTISDLQATTYYVTPNPSDDCLEVGSPCSTLSQVNSTYFSMNTTVTFLFLPGNHSLDSELLIQNAQTLKILPSNLSQSYDIVLVECTKSARLIFDSIDQLVISRIKFVGCVNNYVYAVDQFTLEDCSFQGQEHNGTGIKLNFVLHTKITRCSFSSLTGTEIGNGLSSRGGGALVVLSCLNLIISDTIFSNNTVSVGNGYTSAFGGALYAEESNITLNGSKFEFNSILANSSETDDSKGGALYYVCRSHSNVNVVIENSTFVDNTVTGYLAYGGAISLNLDSSVSSLIVIRKSLFMTNKVFGTYAGGGAMYTTLCTSTNISLYNNTFGGNQVKGKEIGQGGAVNAYVCSLPLRTVSSSFITQSFTASSVVSVESTILYGNCVTGKMSRGGALIINARDSLRISRCAAYYNWLTVHFIKSDFYNNTAEGEACNGGAVFYSVPCSSIALHNSSFVKNYGISSLSSRGGALYIFDCNVEVFGTSFSFNRVFGSTDYLGYNNTTIGQGGALYFNALFTTLVIKNGTFSSNAVVGHFTHGSGGAIKIRTLTLSRRCSYHLLTVEHSTFKNNTVIGEHAQGGAVQSTGKNGCFEMNHVTFIANAAIATIMDAQGGAVGFFGSYFTYVSIGMSHFINNVASANTNKSYGGAVYSYNTMIEIYRSSLINNSAIGQDGGYGGAIYENSTSQITIRESMLSENNAGGYEYGAGGAVLSIGSSITILRCKFSFNSATGKTATGGAMHIDTSTVRAYDTEFVSNTLTGENMSWGGSLFVAFSTLECSNCTYKNNAVIGKIEARGGAIYAAFTIYIGSHHSFFNNTAFANHAVSIGGALFIAFTIFESNSLSIIENTATFSVFYAQQSTLNMTGATSISNNHGSLFIFASFLTINDHTSFSNNVATMSSTFKLFEEGGAVTAFKSEVYFGDTVNLMHNTARNGGGVLLIETDFYAYKNVTITANTAILSGGGIYAYQSDLNLIGSTTIDKNTAREKGGGIYAISSSVFVNSLNAFDSNGDTYNPILTSTRIDFFVGAGTIRTGLPVSELRTFARTNRDELIVITNSVTFSANSAKFGGGLYLETNSKLVVVKFRDECLEGEFCNATNSRHGWFTLQFVNNHAQSYGGALYSADDTNSGICDTSPTYSVVGECVLQDLAIYENPFPSYSRNLLNTYFTNNSAGIAGGTLYGGLLDRCAVTPFAEYFKENADITPSTLDATTYLLTVTNLQLQDFDSPEHISSEAVRICFCENRNHQNCSYQPNTQYVNTGQTFYVSLVAVDQINNIIPNSSIHASLSIQGGLDEGQAIQQTNLDGSCTELSYNVLTPLKSERLLLYAEGPCVDNGISAAYVSVNVIPCPVGFVNTSLRCDCDPYLIPDFVSNCLIDSKSVQRRGRVWITYVNSTEHEAYAHHQYCPFDYCYPPTHTVFINLSGANGSDAQCAFNRSGKLCGSCKDGLSLVLGSSRCLPCSNNWLALLIVFAIAGVLLVAFLLLCNLTVAIGTINGVVLYANIIAANRAIFLPFDKPNILTVFISWINLDFGIETCFYDGMDGYAKVWLQFAFPLYILFLVAMVILIADHSRWFASMLFNRNPVATLATLVLLSYTKFIRLIIAGLSSTLLNYSDGYSENVWLYDGNISYLGGTHIPLFIASIVVLIIGLLYTFLLFFWHWFMQCRQKLSSKKDCNINLPRWISTSKVYTGLYTFMDAYLAPYNETHRYWVGLLLIVRVVLYLISAVNLLANPSINLISIEIVMVCLLLLLSNINGRIYKEWPVGTLENSYFFNLTLFAAVTLYIREVGGNQEALAYTSLSIAFVTFMATICYHGYEFVLKKSKFAKQVWNKVRNLWQTVYCDKRQAKTPPGPVSFDNQSITKTDLSTNPRPTEITIDCPVIPQSTSDASIASSCEHKHDDYQSESMHTASGSFGYFSATLEALNTSTVSHEANSEIEMDKM